MQALITLIKKTDAFTQLHAPNGPKDQETRPDPDLVQYMPLSGSLPRDRVVKAA